MNYIVQSPILFLNFNRPDLSFKVFENIKSVKPSRLYIAVDGPRPGNKTDEELCTETRRIIEHVDWNCTVNTLFQDENLGCKKGVSSAINWFFENENEGIILEDDCLPTKSFFYFCDEMLQKYRYDKRVRIITGTNLQMGNQRGDASYYFSQYSNIWGWASWKSVWDEYDPDLKNYTEEEAARQLKNVFNDPFLISGWLEIFKRLKLNQIDTWDYQFTFITFFENGLCITPNVNLISNLGFREDATHLNYNNHHAGLPTGEIWQLHHPQFFLPDKEADYYFLNKEFNLEEKWLKYRKDKSIRRRVKRWLIKFKNALFSSK